MKAETRRPAIRKAASKEVLAKLHPAERLAIRVFEFFASVKLALVVMVWLTLECIAGALVEHNVNTPAARYLVYGNTRFVCCLSLLGLVLLCAALIRFPWKRYQTGFVITHCGLLILLFGSMLTLRDHLDCLMVVAKNEVAGSDPSPRRLEKVWERTIFDSDREIVEVADLDPRTGDVKQRDRVSVDLGPFTWGQKLFGFFPWRAGYTETLKLAGGDELRLKQFYSNCEREETYVPAEKDVPGAPAALVRIAVRDKEERSSQWLEFPDQPFDTAVGNFGKMTAWRVSTVEQWEHAWRTLAKAAERGRASEDAGGGLLGWLVVEWDGKRRRLRVDDLRRGKPVPIPDSKETIEVLDYFADAVPGTKEGTLVNNGDEPNNPGLRVRLGAGAAAKEIYCLADRKKNSELAAKQPAGARLTYTPTGAVGEDLGFLLTSYKGKHYAFPVAELRDEPVRVPGGEVSIELTEYLPDASLNAAHNGLFNRGDEPNNPALRLSVSEAGKEKKEQLCFADPMLNGMLQRDPELLFSYYVPGKSATIQLILGPDERLAYRAWNRQGIIASQSVEMNKPMPCWPVPQLGTSLEFSVSKLLPNARRDAKLFPRPLDRGDKGERGLIAELRTSAGEVVTTSLYRNPEAVGGGASNLIRLGKRLVQIRLTNWEMEVPFAVRLDDFKEPKIPGTNQAAMFTSIVTVKDKQKDEEEQHVITMNQPLRHLVTEKREGLLAMVFPTAQREYALYQTSISHTPNGPVSTYTVACDPGLLWKYAGGMTLGTGILLMFYMGGYFRASKKRIARTTLLPTGGSATAAVT